MAHVAAPSVTSEPIFQLASGFMASKLLFTVNEIGCLSSVVQEWLGPAGWRFLAHQPLAGPVSLLVAERP